ncbi:hypothetical protein PSHT_11348 [Puccinia striiformis]|uniref:Uncharacterized protein n=1 Tax=Puccinia striiformis TaxID=27350 RepID=A0A2S4V3E9_9BASI|nr:hypothetical protein PSHT_11348 [Puccinia striiformis]
MLVVVREASNSPPGTHDGCVLPRGGMTAVVSGSSRTTIRPQAGNSRNGSRLIYWLSTRDVTVRRRHVQGINVRTPGEKNSQKNAKVADAPDQIYEVTTKLANIRAQRDIGEARKTQKGTHPDHQIPML